VTTLRKTSGYTDLIPGDPGAPGYYRDVPTEYVESGAQCYAIPVTVVAGTFRPFNSGSRNVPAGATLAREVVGADASGNAIYEVTGYYWTDTRVEHRVQCLPTYATIYRREWVPPVPPTAASIRIIGSVGWTGGAHSIGTLAADGALSFEVPVGTTGVVCGLSDSDGGAGYREILYGLYCQHGSAQAISRGQPLGQPVSYSDGTVLSIARTNGLILYMVGGYVAHATSEAPGFGGIALIADASLYAGNDSVVDAQFSGSIPTITGAVASNPSVTGALPEFRLFAADVDSWLQSQAPAFELDAGDPDAYLAAQVMAFALFASDSDELIYCNGRLPEFLLDAPESVDLVPEYNAAFGWVGEFTLTCIDVTVEHETPDNLALSAFALDAFAVGASEAVGTAWLNVALPEFVLSAFSGDSGVGSDAAWLNAALPEFVLDAVSIDAGSPIGSAWLLAPAPEFELSAASIDGISGTDAAWLQAQVPEFKLDAFSGDAITGTDAAWLFSALPEFRLDAFAVGASSGVGTAWLSEPMPEFKLSAVSLGAGAGAGVAWLDAMMPEIVCAGYITDADSIYSGGSFSGFTAEVYINPVSLSVDTTTGDAVGAAIFLSPPSLSISATTENSIGGAVFRSGNIISIIGTTDSVTSTAVFGNGASLSINTSTDNAVGAAYFLAVPGLSISAITEDVAAGNNISCTYVYHPDHDSFTEYTEFPFNSYARIGGSYFAASSDGLYLLGGGSDSGVNIEAHILTGMLDFGGHMMSRTPRVYLDFSGDSGLAVSVYTSSDGLRRTEAFTLSLPTAPVDRSACLPLGRGLPSHFWQYRVSNVAGGKLEFTRCAPHVIPLTRSI